jgi:hypothetical protein
LFFVLAKDMNKFSQNDLDELIRYKEYPGISIYLKTHVKGLEMQQDHIKLKNLLNKCQNRLERKWAREKVLAFLKPGFNLQDDSLFWSHQSEGLALFISHNFLKYFNLSVAPQEKLYIGNYFYILPLLPVLLKNKTYYILVLRQKDVKLFLADFSNIREVELHNVPHSIEEILQFDVTEEYLSARMVSSGRIPESSLYYGQGDLPDNTNRKKHTEMFLKEVAKRVDKQLQGNKIPLILAGVEYDQAIYRQNSTYRHILDKGFSNNFGKFDVKEIHKLAQKIIQPYFVREIEESVLNFQNLINTHRTSADIREILPAAYSGRVDTLLLDISMSISGTVDEGFQKVEIGGNEKKDVEDLLNLAAIYTLQSDTKVYPVLEEDIGAPIAAVFRY